MDHASNRARALPPAVRRDFAIFLAAGTAVALAQATPANAAASGASLGEVVVTARRVEEKLQDVPISITVYNQQQITSRNIVSTVDLATYTPSLTVNTRFGQEKAFFALRGFTQEPNTAPSVGVYFADVVAPRLQVGTGGGNGAGVGALMDLQNIQVLKGPQGTLFGRNTTGGAILIVPQKPTREFEGWVQGTVGNYGAKRLEAVVNAPINDRFRARLAIDRFRRDGYLHNRSGIGPTDLADADYVAVRLSAVADLMPNLEDYAVFSFSDSDTNGVLGRPAVCNRTGAGTPLDGSAAPAAIRNLECAGLDARTTQGFDYYDVTNSYPAPYEKQRQWQIVNTTTWRANDALTVKNIASYARSRESTAFNIEGDLIPTPFAVLIGGVRGPQGQMSTVTEELQVQGASLEERLTWQAGGYLEVSKPTGPEEQYSAIFGNGCTNFYAFQCTSGSISIGRQDYWFHNYGAYAQAIFRVTSQLSVTLGGRYTWDKIKSTSDNITVTATPTGPAGPSSYRCSQAATPTDPATLSNLLSNRACFLSFTTSSKRPTWLIDVDYKPTEDILAYAKYARGYRAGGINPQTYSFRAPTLLPAWGPEKVDSYEVGLKTSWRSAISGTVNVAAFYNKFQNQQLSINIPACSVGAAQPSCNSPPALGINGIFNAGRSRIKGLEADASLELTQNLRVDLGYAYLDAKVVGTNLPPCTPTQFNCAAATFPNVGDRIPLSPKNRITATGTYTLPVDESIGHLEVSATWTHTSRQYFSHGDDHAFAIGVIPFNPSHLPAVSLLNLNLDWRNVAGKPVDLSLFASNVTQEKYWVASTNALSSTGADFVQVGPPRMYGVRMKYHFGR
jgi:iron complex outermembrane receptor protein